MVGFYAGSMAFPETKYIAYLQYRSKRDGLYSKQETTRQISYLIGYPRHLRTYTLVRTIALGQYIIENRKFLEAQQIDCDIRQLKNTLNQGMSYVRCMQSSRARRGDALWYHTPESVD